LEVAVKKDELTYAQAMERLETIVARLEGGDVSVDELSASVKEGVRLVTWCRKRLRTTQEEIEAALSGMDAPESGGSSPRTSPRASNETIETDEADPFA
jgi:exodeoxyribonuclease VII small subunit